jgi:hypothetical protein
MAAPGMKRTPPSEVGALVTWSDHSTALSGAGCERFLDRILARCRQVLVEDDQMRLRTRRQLAVNPQTTSRHWPHMKPDTF